MFQWLVKVKNVIEEKFFVWEIMKFLKNRMFEFIDLENDG